MKEAKLPSIVSILILTIITVIMWISFSVYRAFTQKPAAPVQGEISKPLDPSLDTQTLNQIQSRMFLQDSEIPDAVASSQPAAASTPIAPVITPSPTPIPSETPLPTGTPVETAAP